MVFDLSASYYHLNCDKEIFLLQLPDYHDIVKHPMDFGTIRKKLDEGLYVCLEQFEVGIAILICLYESVSAPKPSYLFGFALMQEIMK